MRRTTTVTLVAAVLLALTAGAAPAPITCPTDNNTNECKGTSDADTMNGTPGRDFMGGWDGEDTLNGLAGDDIMSGHAGNDTLNGNDGDDKIDALEPEGEGADTVSGGPGNDTIGANDGVKGDDIDCGPGSRDIAYSDKGDSVSSNCEWQPPYDTAQYCPASGPPWTPTTEEETGDWPWGMPYVGEKIIWCIDGTPRDDKKLDGTTGYSDLLDTIWADKGNDKINGGVGPDSIEGWAGNDIVKGGAGKDFLYGDSSANPWEEGHFFKAAGNDKIYGGPGDDFISAIDNKKDTISCGGGKDLVLRDKRGYVDDPTGPALKSTVTDMVAHDCEEIVRYSEHSSFFCRIFGHRKRH